MAGLDEKSINLEDLFTEEFRNFFRKRRQSKPRHIYELFCRFSEKILGPLTRNMKISDETSKILQMAEIHLSSSAWLAGFFLSVLAPVTIALLLWLLLSPNMDLLALWYTPLLGLVIGILCGSFFYLYPISLAEAGRIETQSRAIYTIMLISFFLHQKPDLRGAVVFAADMEKGRLADDLRKGLIELDNKRKYESVRHLLTTLAHEWGEIDEGLRTAIFDILRSTGQKEESARVHDLIQAPKRLLESNEAQLMARLNSLVLPTMAFVVFSSLIIVAAIGLSPLFSVIGLHLMDLRFYILVALSIVLGFLTATFYLSKRRPVIFPHAEIDWDDPRLSARRNGIINRMPPWLPSLLLFTILSFPAFAYYADHELAMFCPFAHELNTFWIIWATCAAISVYAYLYSRERAKIRAEERKTNADWEVALNTIGSRVIDGKSMHRAILETAELMPNTDVSDQLRKIGVSVEKLSTDMGSVLTEFGFVRRIWNPLISSFMTIISQIRRGSETTAGRACMLAADFLEMLRTVEGRFRDRMDEALGNLWLVAAILLPVTCAMSVWVIELMSGISLSISHNAIEIGISSIPFLAPSFGEKELAFLKLIMGLMTITLSIIFSRYIAIIRAGNDKVEFWGTVAKTLVLAITIFTSSYFGLKLIV